MAAVAAVLVTTLTAAVAGASSPPPTEPRSAAAEQPQARLSVLARAGVPRGWVPKRTHRGTYVVRRAGAVVEDLRIRGDLIVDAPRVTIRRVEVVGGRIDNFAGARCQNGLRIVATTVRRAKGQVTSDQDLSAIGIGGYVARRVAIRGLPEGFRVGGNSTGCGPVTIVGSYARATAPTRCDDWHGDALQGYDGPRLTIRDSVLVLAERRGCYGTAAFFYPRDQGNTRATVENLRVRGGGYPFRLGTPGSVQGLGVVEGSWGYGPIDVACRRLSAWRASIVARDGSGHVRSLPCRTNGGY